MAQELTYKWVQDRLRDLHAGKLSAQDKARLESIALKDPFVADALEGYEAHPDATHDAYLAALAEKIRHAPRERRRWLIPNLTVTAIAASVMLIIATYAVISRMEPQAEKEVLVVLTPDSLLTTDTSLLDAVVSNEQDEAEVRTEAEDVPGLPLNPTSTSSARRLKGTSNSETGPTGSANSSRSQTITSPIADHNLMAVSESTSAEVMTTPEETEPKTIVVLDEFTGSPVPPVVQENTVQGKMKLDSRDEGLYANQMNPDLMARRVTGRVISSSGDPLHGADIRVANTNLGVTSSDEGRFELFLPLPQNEIEVYLPGYAQTQVQLVQGEVDKDIVLEPSLEDAILSSQNLDTQDTQRDDATQPAAAGTSRAQVTPDGWTDYLKSNTRVPLRENYYMPGKEVTVEFIIRSNGKADHVRLLRSSGEKQYDEEAMRLIREWDKWQCQVKDCQKEYTLYFE